MIAPNLGDFVVLSIDPVASVSHLDHVAKEAAALLPVRRYLALAKELHLLPMESNPLHPYDFHFVRQGLPKGRLPGYDSPDSCVAILPNTHQVASREPVCPAQPLPWEDCYIDATYGFPFACRVTSTKRDYYGVLPMLDEEFIRVANHCFESNWELMKALRDEHGADWRQPQPLDLVDATPLLQSPNDGSLSQQFIAGSSHMRDDLPDDSALSLYGESDDISMIGSDDGDAPRSESESQRKKRIRELEYELRVLSEHGPRLPTAEQLRKPIVNVWYDLDMITEIVDPVHFLEDVKRIHMIMDDAEIRLGHRSVSARLHEQPPRISMSEDAARSHSSATSSLYSTTDSGDSDEEPATTDAGDKKPVVSTNSACRMMRLRALFRSALLSCSRPIFALAHKLVPVHQSSPIAVSRLQEKPV
ncbi:unnamed protein product [Peniophora sp. CBMAI 1063]|nr:unnamed protein product [Peniophora sp. CBMAI 1063]